MRGVSRDLDGVSGGGEGAVGTLESVIEGQ